MPIQRRLPKRGFTPLHRAQFTLINLRDLKSFENGSTVDLPVLIQKGIIRHLKGEVKLLGHGEIASALTVKVHRCSQGARQKIEAAGGTVEVM
jgi:large subunit ribosomal protein L15